MRDPEPPEDPLDEVLVRYLKAADRDQAPPPRSLVALYPEWATGEHDGRPYVVLEYVPGGSLARLLTGRPAPPADAARLVEALARAVHYAHQRGVIHRDLKPSNILLQRSEDRGQRSKGGKVPN